MQLGCVIMSIMPKMTCYGEVNLDENKCEYIEPYNFKDMEYYLQIQMAGNKFVSYTDTADFAENLGSKVDAVDLS